MNISKYDLTFEKHHVEKHSCSFLTFTAHDKHLSKGGDESEFWVDGFINVTNMGKVPKYIGCYQTKRSTCQKWWVTDVDGVNISDDLAAVSCAEFQIN